MCDGQCNILQPLATNKSPSHLDDRFMAIPGAETQPTAGLSETGMDCIHQVFVRFPSKVQWPVQERKLEVPTMYIKPYVRAM